MWYDLKCDECEYKESDVEIPLSKANFPIKCPCCGKKKFTKDWTSPEASSFGIQDLTPKTIGQLSDQNKKLMGKELCQKKDEELLGKHGMKKKNAPKPWYWDKDQTKPLDTTKIKDLKKYVETGEKS